jgi:ABC-type Zn uptake system ZnuABC Zn-binding protein ZnuA
MKDFMPRFFFRISLLFLLTFATAHAQEETLQVVTSTTIIADIAKNVGGEFVNITALVPPDSDIHGFELRPSDLRLLNSADLILINGAGLEQFPEGLLADVEPEKIVTIANGIEVLAFAEEENEYLGVLGEDLNCDEEDELKDEHAHGECDPHFWFDPMNVIQMTDNIAAAFGEIDPQHATQYQSKAESYREQLEALDTEIRELMNKIPEEKHLLVTNHEFLAYFAQAYNFQIIATVIPSVSTLAEPTPRELASLIQRIEEDAIPAIFSEFTDSSQLAEIILEEVGTELEIVQLYSESLSAETGPAATYLDYMRFNAETIFDAINNS